MQDVEEMARLALAAAQREYDEAVEALRVARELVEKKSDVAALTADLATARRRLVAGREAYHRAAQAMEATLQALSLAVTRFEQAEVVLRMARAAQGDPAATRLVADELARLNDELTEARNKLEAAARSLATVRR